MYRCEYVRIKFPGLAPSRYGMVEAGVFFSSWKSYINLEEKEMLPLTGSCVFIYPVYEMPVV